VRDLGDLAPDLERLFRDLPPLIRASRTGVPALQHILEGARPLVDAAHVFLPELNPILSNLNYHQKTIGGFISNGAPDLNSTPGGERAQTQFVIFDGRSFDKHTQQPKWERGNAYLAPNALQRAIALGTFESFDCKPSGGEVPDPDDQVDNPNPLTKDANKSPPCLVQPPSLYNGKQFVKLERGVAPKKDAPGFRDGAKPAVDPNPGDPRR
jgi:hypothetical protein